MWIAILRRLHRSGSRVQGDPVFRLTLRRRRDLPDRPEASPSGDSVWLLR